MGRGGCHEEESVLGVPPTQRPTAMEQLSLVQLGVSIPGFRKWEEGTLTCICIVSDLEVGRITWNSKQLARAAATHRVCILSSYTSFYCQSCHEGLCSFLLTECPACKGLIRLSEKEHHTEQECPKRSLSCQHCRAPCSREDLEVHWAGTAWVAVSIAWAFSKSLLP